MLSRTCFLLSALLVCATASCRAPDPPSNAADPSGGTTYATTIYAFRAILEPVVGSNGTVRNLLPAGASPHTYDPRPSDVRAASEATALFFGAPELDRWASSLGSAPAVALIDLLPDSLLIGFPPSRRDAGEHQHASGRDVGGHRHASGRDPHFWMDPLRVDAMLPALVETLCELDSGGCESFRSNAVVFSRRLRALDDSVRSVMAPVQGRAVLLSHPFIQYFAERYGLRTAGVIEEMPGSEPTARDMQRIIQDVRLGGADAIVTLPQLPDRAAQAVAETVGIPVLELDPNGGLRDGETYEMLILYNAHELRRGLLTDPGL